MAKSKILRSFIHEKFPMELRVQLDILSRRRDIQNKPKHEKLIELLRQYNIGNIVQLGPGTNRYAIRLDGFVVKFATDSDGKIDNFKEFTKSKALFPYVAKTYEVSENGTILIAEYIQPFDTYAEMQKYADRIREILTKLSTVFLIGDVGISSKNFKNWGIRTGTNEPVCLDYAYVYDVSSELFLCRACNNNSMLVPNKDFTELYCPSPGCGKHYTFEDIRARLSDEAHLKEIGDLSEEGYRMYDTNVLTELDEQRSSYLTLNQKKKKEEKVKEPEKQLPQEDNFHLEHPPAYYIGRPSNNQGGTNTMNYKVAKNIANDVVVSHTPVTAVAQTETQGTKARIVVAKSYIATEAPVAEAEPATEELGAVDQNTEFATVTQNPAPRIFKVSEEQVINSPEVEIETDDEADTQPVLPKVDIVFETDEEDEDIAEPTEPVETAEEVAAKPPEEETSQSDTDDVSANSKHIARALSKFANCIETELYVEQQLFDQISNDICGSGRFYPGDFYKIIQNCVFRSLTEFIGMLKIEIPGADAPKIYWEMPEEINPDVMPTLIYINRMWKSKTFTRDMTMAERNEEYLAKYDDYFGIQKEWLDFLDKRLKLKLKGRIEDYAIDDIVNIIADICVNINGNYEADDESGTEPADEPEDNTPEEDEAAEEDTPETVEEETEEVADESLEETSDMTPEQAAEEAFREIFCAEENAHKQQSQIFAKPTIGVVADDESSVLCECDDDEESDEDDEESPLNLRVDIFKEETHDIIKITTEDAFGEIAIPIYVEHGFYDELDGFKKELAESDFCNGYWGWLVHFVPDAMFETTNPAKWMAINDLELTDDTVQVRAAIFDQTDDKYIIGLYYISGIYNIDSEYEPHFCSDPTTLETINAIICHEMENCRMSRYEVNLANTDLIYSEEAFESLLNPILQDHECDNDDDEESSEGTPIYSQQKTTLPSVYGESGITDGCTTKVGYPVHNGSTKTDASHHTNSNSIFNADGTLNVIRRNG